MNFELDRLHVKLDRLPDTGVRCRSCSCYSNRNVVVAMTTGMLSLIGAERRREQQLQRLQQQTDIELIRKRRKLP